MAHGSAGARALAAMLTPEQRHEKARQAARARWSRPMPREDERYGLRYGWLAYFWRNVGENLTDGGGQA